MAWLQSVRASAAMVSPPPTTVVPVQAATARAISTVPWRNGGISKTPIGPFQTTVRAVRSTSRKRTTVGMPISKPFQPTGIPSSATRRVGASGLMSWAIT